MAPDGVGTVSLHPGRRNWPRKCVVFRLCGEKQSCFAHQHCLTVGAGGGAVLSRGEGKCCTARTQVEHGFPTSPFLGMFAAGENGASGIDKICLDLEWRYSISSATFKNGTRRQCRSLQRFLPYRPWVCSSRSSDARAAAHGAVTASPSNCIFNQSGLRQQCSFTFRTASQRDWTVRPPLCPLSLHSTH